MYRLKINKEIFNFDISTNGMIETGLDDCLIKATTTGLYFSKSDREKLELLKEFVIEIDELVDNYKEDVKPSVINSNDIVDAMAKMQERGIFPSMLVTTPKGYAALRLLPSYNPEFLYGKEVVENELGAIEGLVVQVLVDLPENTMYLEANDFKSKS